MPRGFSAPRSTATARVSAPSPTPQLGPSRARQVAQRLHDAVTALPEADRVPALVAVVRTLLDDAPDAMVTLDRAMRDAATWREVGITAEHERTAAELVREVGL